MKEFAKFKELTVRDWCLYFLSVAQEKDTVDPNLAEQLSALSRKTDEAYNNGDTTTGSNRNAVSGAES